MNNRKQTEKLQSALGTSVSFNSVTQPKSLNDYNYALKQF